MKGRKPKTTHALRLAGSERLKLRTNEPNFAGVPRCPEWLNAYAREVWERVVPDLISTGVTRAVDQDALCAYCLAAADVRKAEEAIAKDGMTIMSRGSLVKHPMIAIRNEAMTLLARYASEFGLTGASRSKVKAKSGKEGSDGKSRFFAPPAAPPA